MTVGAIAVRRTFQSLSIRNYRLYFVGQAVSMSGTWAQMVAQSWLVLQLTGSGTAIGLVTAAQFLPMLFLAPFGGLIADRWDKRRLLFMTQGLAAVLAALLGVLVITDTVELWMVYAIALCLGLVASVDTPTRQTFIMEMVGRESVANAVTLNSVLVNAARIVGPAFAGVLIIAVGIGVCFLINAASYLAVLVALVMMRASELDDVAPQPRRRGQLREGVRYVRATTLVLVPLLMMALLGTFVYEYSVVLPVFAKFTFGGDAGTFAAMTACMGAGAVVGGLITAARRSRTAVSVAIAAIVLGGVQMLTALAPTITTALIALAALGAASISFLALGNAALQLSATPEMRGRVMGLWAMAFLGSTPIGGPIIGWMAETIGPRIAISFGGIVAIIAGGLGYRILSGVDEQTSVAPDIDMIGPTAKLGT